MTRPKRLTKQVTPVFAARTIGRRVSTQRKIAFSKMLSRAGGVQKPAIVRHVGEQVRAAQDKLPGQLAERILETNQRRDLHLVSR